MKKKRQFTIDLIISFYIIITCLVACDTSHWEFRAIEVQKTYVIDTSKDDNLTLSPSLHATRLDTFVSYTLNDTVHFKHIKFINNLKSKFK